MSICRENFCVGNSDQYTHLGSAGGYSILNGGSRVGGLRGGNSSSLPSTDMFVSQLTWIQSFAVRQLTNPFRLSWTLIQLGYEPLPPKPLFTWLLGSSFSCYPNLFHYTYHLVRSIGFWKAMTTGMGANFGCELLGQLSELAINHRALLWQQAGVDDQSKCNSPFLVERLLEQSSWLAFARRLTEVIALKGIVVTLNQPFYVINLRQIASIVTSDPSSYTWIFTAAGTIYRRAGIAGFYQGLGPRLVSELAPLVAYYACCRLIRLLVTSSRQSTSKDDDLEVEASTNDADDDLMNFIRPCLYLFLHHTFYTFQIVSSLSALRGAGLASNGFFTEADNRPSWWRLLTYLHSAGQANRGRLPFFRSHIQPNHLSQ